MNRDRLAARLLTTFLGELEEQVRAMNADVLALEQAPSDAQRLKSLFRVAHTLKGAARAAGVSPIEQACQGLEALLVEARDGKLTLGAQHFELLFKAADALSDAGARLKTDGELTDAPIADLARTLRTGAPTSGASAAVPVQPPGSTRVADRGDGEVRVPAEKLDALLAASGQLLVTAGQVATRPVQAEALHEFATRWTAEWRRSSRGLRLALHGAGAAPGLSRTVAAVDERLAHLVGDAARLADAAEEDARNVRRLSDDLAHHVRTLRMRPFAEACEALPRAVRDLATAVAKEVRLEVRGGEVEADREVLDGLREALLHVVRNAVDHGIEPPDVRERAGKPRQGTVTLTAVRAGDRIAVTVADDGAGLDISALRARLTALGGHVPSADPELVRAVFEGGISTRHEATAISGRGVGLNLVQEAVRRIRGTVDVTWEAGRGTTFMLECPPSLATIHALVVAVGPQWLAIPTSHVARVLRVRHDEIRHVEGRDVVAVGEALAPLVSLARLLPPLVVRPVGDPIMAVLLASGGRHLAIAVDELVAEQEAVVRPLPHRGGTSRAVSGAALLGPGRVALVLDPAVLVAAGLDAAGAAELTLAAVPEQAPARRRVLVVDDSITTRTLEQSILEAAGYEVVTAVDGQDAWKALQERGADLVVADVEMPRMDGFALCEAIRASARFKTLPVVLVTALETPEHRARGLEVGADAYVGKSSFDQQALLDTIRQLIE